VSVVNTPDSGGVWLAGVVEATNDHDRKGVTVVIRGGLLEPSARRAMSVVRYLVAHGVNPDLLSAQAFGTANPVANGEESSR
jgi:outer membrane protein OmpA-like peptidoglycan-associated protein